MTNSYNRLINALSKYSNATSELRSSELLYGTIVSLEPLKIKISTFKEPLTEEFLVLGQMVRPHTVTIPHKHEYNGITELANDGQGADHQHEIKQQITEDLHVGTGGYEQESVILEIYPKLSVGDIVLMFSFNNGQKYYVAERILPNASRV